MPPSGRFPLFLPPSLSAHPISWVRAMSREVLCASSLAGVQDITGEQDRRGGFQVPRCLAGQVLCFRPPSPAQPHEHLSLLHSESILHMEASTVITASPLRPLSHHQHVPVLLQEATPHNAGPKTIITGPPLAWSYFLPRCPLLFSPWSSAIALLSGTPTLGSISRTPGTFQADCDFWL